MMDGAAVGEWLRRRIGLDPSSGGPGLAARGLRARMKALAIPSAEWERYLALLERSETEAEALVDEVTVPESWFFRDEGPFAYLGGPIASRWLNDPARPPLRLLSVPCARGEEPYSAAIALLDRGLPPARFTVDAVDVSKPLLDAVRRGIYGDNAFRTSELAFRDRHFRPTASGYELRPELKRLVNTHHGNLIDPEFLADQRAYDVIFCRNLLIYFDEPARQRALANLDRLLSPDGILFVGHAEQLGILSPRFRPAGDRGTFAFERVAAPPESGPAAAHAPRRARSASKTEKRAAKRSGENAGTSRRVAGVERSEPPVRQPSPRGLAALDPSHPSHPDKVSGAVSTPVPPLVEAARLADAGKHAEAAVLCEREIRARGPSAAAFYLLGVIRQAAGQGEQAAGYFEKTVYLDPRHDDALLNLALLAQRRGDLAAADNFRRRAERAFQDQEKPPR